MDTETTPQQQEAVVEKDAAKSEDASDAEKPQAAYEEAEKSAVNGHDAQVTNLKETEESVVIDKVTATEQKMEPVNILPKEESEAEPVPTAVTAPEPGELSEKISHPVSALETKPENVQPEQQPVPENDPEGLLMQAPLAESTPEPATLAESVPEAQTLHESATMQQPVDTQEPSKEDKVLEQVEAQAELQTKMDTGAGDAVKEQEPKSDIIAEPAKEGEKPKPEDSEKAADTALVAEVSSEKPAETEMSKEEKSGCQKEVEPETAAESVALKGAQAEGEDVKFKENEKEEDSVPAPGSLSFALLEQEQTKDALCMCRTLVVLRGLPGSGKSFLARAIANTYKDQCSVISADDHGVKPEDVESSAGGYKALDEAVVACCSAETASPLLIVVDDTNHTQDRLARLQEIAEEHSLVAVFLEPQTEWRRDLAQLTKKTSRGLEVAQLETLKGPLEEMSIPLFFAWFLLSSVQDKVGSTSLDFLKTLQTLEAFKKHMSDFKAEKEVDLEQYFEAKGVLHCTTKFCNYGKAEGAQEYAQKQAVKDFYGSTSELSLSALFVTPRTVGARVSLTEEQLLLWPADAEKEAESVPAAASLPLGSRAHITLGCAEGVEPVQTGLDLLEILALQQEGQQGELVEEMALGSLTFYGKGRWLLSLREPICAPACFSGYYTYKEPELTKKEPEKKKKPKCTIL
uniref:2',3'-cyclic-nucleotide 3'-phosphodiesterase n=1 Tax=Monopterus albus TaxID=43700 RepID=A0A3Q3J8G0_MONAL|nr:2',3'-cyclic-nucleotide 3'-phosphodiesterase [Monopterus albus]